MTAFLINHLRQPGVVHSDVLDYLDQVLATLDPFGGKFIVLTHLDLGSHSRKER